jgi:C1A family cysteine protease
LMQFEEWGVWDDDAHNTIVSHHSLMVVGWSASSTPTAHWIVKNSWGPVWGNKGFGRLPWTESDCVLAFEPFISTS